MGREVMAEVVEYQHGTCTNVHPRFSLKNGDTFKTLCGITDVKNTGKAHLPKCAMCEEAFKMFAEGSKCTLCGDTRAGH